MKRFTAFLVACGLTTLAGLAGCQNKTIEPVAIEPNDMCAFCRMSISERQYAAELIHSDGEAAKFDDLGCLANFMKQKQNGAVIRATFVMDFERREWVNAEDAFYVRSSALKTPMSGGIVAFTDEFAAQAAAAKYQGTMLRFAEITGPCTFIRSQPSLTRN